MTTQVEEVYTKKAKDQAFIYVLNDIRQIIGERFQGSLHVKFGRYSLGSTEYGSIGTESFWNLYELKGKVKKRFLLFFEREVEQRNYLITSRMRDCDESCPINCTVCDKATYDIVINIISNYTEKYGRKVIISKDFTE